MRSRSGFSLTELIIALALFSILLATTMGFYRQQGKAFTEGNDRMTLMQNLRYGVSSLEQNLRTAGINVPHRQPVVVHAGEDVFAFNADFASRTANDFFAVYQDTDLPAEEASALTSDRKFTLPGTSWAYPDSSYSAGAGNSPAETIIFFFAADSSTARTDDYTLYRQVNDTAPAVVARHLLRTAKPFFSYFVLVDDGTGTAETQPAPAHYVPSSHSEAIHGSPADTGRVAATDSILGVQISYAATNGLTGEREVRREVTRLIQLINAPRYDAQRTCGNKPLLGTSLLATAVPSTATDPAEIRLSWGQATDEATGEMDALRYVVWRRVEGTTAWGDPYVSLSPGSSTYSYSDRAITAGTRYYYALAVQDCTPQYSEMVSTGPVTAPS